MDIVSKVEGKLAELFAAAPALPKQAKAVIVRYLPYLALASGILSILSAWTVWSIARNAEQVREVLNYYSSIANVRTELGTFEYAFIYLAAIVVLLQGIIALVAFKPLKEKLRRGWQLLFLSALVGFVYSVVTLFVHGRGVGSFLLNLIGVAITFYLLFQIRDAYSHRAASASSASPTTATAPETQKKDSK